MRMLIVPLAAALLGLATLTASAADEAKDAKDVQKRLEQAQKKMEEAARELAELSARADMGSLPDRMVFLGRNPNRAMLGIGIGGEKENEREDGVAVLSVSPGGPASDAGIKAGDVIVELNGKSLKRDKQNSSREKLLDIMSKLSPGDEANVRYTRDGKAAVVKLKVDSLPREEIRSLRIMPDRGPQHGPGFDYMFDTFQIMGNRSVLGDLEMVPLTPTMGQYFGAEKGLLIVRAPKDNKEVQLEDGDVLLDIDGRAPSDPGHAYRILRSYQPGEKLTLNVLRQRKKIAIPVTTPERSEREGFERIEKKRITVPLPAAPGRPAPIPPPRRVPIA